MTRTFLSSVKGFPARVKEGIRWRLLESVFSDQKVTPYMAALAAFVIRRQKPFIIGVTGSVGKTTTKEMIVAVLTHPDAVRSLAGRVGMTHKNMNDDVGVPLAILQYDDWLNEDFKKMAKLCLLPFRALRLAFTSNYPKLLVIEFGTHWRGHLHRLAEVAPPNIGVVTTIGPAHLERLKTLEGVFHEKSAVIRAVGPDGLVVLGDDHSFVARLEASSRAPVLKVRGRGAELSRNIATAIGRRLGIPEATIESALSEFKPPQGRLDRFETECFTVIDDTYNANPLSMRLALDTLADTAKPGQRRVAVLGGMAELGDETLRYHREIADYARDRADVLIGVGELAKHYMADQWCADSHACATGICNILRPGDCVLVKGSASARMVRVVSRLRERSAAAVSSG